MISTAASFPLCFFIAISGLAAQSADPIEQGVTLHKRSSAVAIAGQENHSQTSTMYFNGDSIREVSSDGTELLILHAEDRLVRIDHRSRTYSELTFAELEQRLERISDEIEQKSSEDQETMRELQELLGPRGQIRLEREGPGEQLAGFDTMIYRVSIPPLNLRIWAAPALKVPAVYFDSLKLHVRPNPLFNMEELFETFKQIDGLSLKTVVTMNVMGTEITSTDEVVKVELGPVPPPAIPEGYSRVEVDF